MGIIFDVIVIAILSLSIFMGYRKGLIGVVFDLCAFVVALVITFVLYNPITNLVIENTDFDEKIESVIIENGVTEETERDNDNEEKNILNEYIDKYVSNAVTDAKNDVIESSARVIAEKVVGICVAIALFIVIRIVLIFAKFLADGIASLPIIKQFNKLGGTLYGGLRGLVIVFIILAILFFIVSVNNNVTIINAIDSSIITKILYSNNIILNIIF